VIVDPERERLVGGGQDGGLAAHGREDRQDAEERVDEKTREQPDPEPPRAAADRFEAEPRCDEDERQNGP
jgi:hypothetical protein